MIKFKDLQDKLNESFTGTECGIDGCQPDIFLDEETGDEYYIEMDEETLIERKIVIRVNSKGQKSKLIKCGPGRVLKTVNGRKICVTPTGRARLQKKLAIRKGNRTKRAKGAGYRKRIIIKRQKALRKRHAMGLK